MLYIFVLTIDLKAFERRLTDALSKLDAESRMIVVLRDIYGVTYDELHEITGLPLGTVKSRLHRARSQLRDKVKRDR